MSNESDSLPLSGERNTFCDSALSCPVIVPKTNFRELTVYPPVPRVGGAAVRSGCIITPPAPRLPAVRAPPAPRRVIYSGSQWSGAARVMRSRGSCNVVRPRPRPAPAPPPGLCYRYGYLSQCLSKLERRTINQD